MMNDLNKLKITDHQLMSITAAFVCGASVIIISSSTTAIAKQDSWISVIFTMLVGLIIVWINTHLGKLYTDKTYIETIQLILGKWIGGFVAAGFIFVCFVGAPQFIWYVGDFFTMNSMIKTPSYIINILFTIVVVIALFYGIEVIARASELFFYGIIIMFTLSMLGVAPKMHINSLLPVMEQGVAPILKGSLPLFAFTVLPTIILNMVYPVNVENINSAKKSIFKGYIIGMTITFTSVIMCTLVLGSEITADARFPVFLLTKEINIGVIITRLEALIVNVWLLTIFNNTVFYFYAAVLGLAQLLKLKNHKKIILPLGLIMAVFSGFIYHDVLYEIKWDTEVWILCISSFGLFLPILLLIVFSIKKYVFKIDAYKK